MADVVLSAAVRQNLLSLQSTAALLSTTQNNLATGKKVNSALDNPTNFFTAQSLDNRAGDINNLLDGIGNGVQVLQAANTGITSLQKLVDAAKSVANQVLQTQVGYSAKSTVVATPIPGANATNLLGTPTFADATFASLNAGTAQTTAFSAGGPATGTVNLADSAAAAATAATKLDPGAATHLATATLTSLNGQSLTINGSTLTFDNTVSGVNGAGTANETIGIKSGTTATVQDVLNFIQTAGGTGTTATVISGAITITTGTASDVTISGTAAGTLGLSTVARVATNTPTALTPGTLLSGVAGAAPGALSTAFGNNDTLAVDNKLITFSNTAATTAPPSANGGTINLATGTVQDVLDAIDAITGSSGPNAASITNGQITLHTGTAATLTIGSSNPNALAALGLTGGVNQPRTSATALGGETLTIGATGLNGVATNITFGTAPGEVQSLNDLNTQLAPNNLQATIDANGLITIQTTNDDASATIGAFGGTAVTTAGAPFAGLTVGSTPVKDPNVQATRAGLVNQYNNILKQIDTTAQDSSFNGINLLEDDTLNLVFDETGASKLAIQGTTFSSAGLGLSQLTQGTDFLDSSSANKVLGLLSTAGSQLRSEASTLGSNLSIVQIRQDFSKNLINVLQTGSANLTIADTNEEAANSQALSTRQSIAVSALALANQSQQSVLQLLR